MKEALERGALIIDVREREEYERARIPTAIFAEMGFCNVYDFRGSFREWVEKGYEIERSRP